MVKGLFTNKKQKHHGSAFSTAHWISFINFKATIESTKKPGKPYPDFVLSTTCETDKHLVFYMLHGIDLLPQV